MVTLRTVRVFCAWIAVLTLVVVGLGGYVRATGAGLACPDWPLCYGRIIPPEFLPGVMQELVHRILAGIVTVLTVILAWRVYKARAQYPRLWTAMVFVLVILAIQIVLGGLTVLMLLNPFIVTAHLVLGTVFFQVLTVIAVERRSQVEQANSSGFRFIVVLTTVVVFLQIILGGFVGSSGASLVCPNMLWCTDKFLPADATAMQMTQMLHRIVGIVIAVLAAVLLVMAFRSQGLASKYRGHLFGVLFMVVVQIIIGMLNVYWKIPTTVTVIHLVVAQLILLALLILVQGLYPALKTLPVAKD